MKYSNRILSILFFSTCLFFSSNVFAQLENTDLEEEPVTIETVTWEEADFALPNPLPAKYQYILLYDAKPLNTSKEVYGEENVDRAPLFAETCVNELNPEDCSNDLLKQFIKENLEYPDEATRRNHDGLEHVVVVINEFGKIEGNIKVISKENPCAGCTKAAVEVVEEMENWVPARKNGLAVKARVVIPIEFETIGYAR